MEANGRMYTDYLILGIIVILLFLLVISIIKKAIKLIIGIILIFAAFSFYNIAVKGVSPVDELNGYKINISYSIAIANYTREVQKSVSDLKLVLDSKNMDDKTKAKIKTDNENLHKDEAEIIVLKHTEKLNFFHKRYCEYVNTIVKASDTAASISDASESSLNRLQESVKEAGNVFQSLSQLKINDFIK